MYFTFNQNIFKENSIYGFHILLLIGESVYLVFEGVQRISAVAGVGIIKRLKICKYKILVLPPLEYHVLSVLCF